MNDSWTRFTPVGAPTFLIGPGMVEPVVYDHRIPTPLPYSEWFKWQASEQYKQTPGRIYAHL